jgi:hypothetical protein
VTVIADTSPLNYLILIGTQDLLPILYPSIRIAPAGASELAAPGAPEKVRQWIENRPDWLVVAAPRDLADPRLAHLDKGERKRSPLPWNLKRMVAMTSRVVSPVHKRKREDKTGIRARRNPAGLHAAKPLQRSDPAPIAVFLQQDTVRSPRGKTRRSTAPRMSTDSLPRRGRCRH